MEVKSNVTFIGLLTLHRKHAWGPMRPKLDLVHRKHVEVNRFPVGIRVGGSQWCGMLMWQRALRLLQCPTSRYEGHSIMPILCCLLKHIWKTTKNGIKGGKRDVASRNMHAPFACTLPPGTGLAVQ